MVNNNLAKIYRYLYTSLLDEPFIMQNGKGDVNKILPERYHNNDHRNYYLLNIFGNNFLATFEIAGKVADDKGRNKCGTIKFYQTNEKASIKETFEEFVQLMNNSYLSKLLTFEELNVDTINQIKGLKNVIDNNGILLLDKNKVTESVYCGLQTHLTERSISLKRRINLKDEIKSATTISFNNVTIDNELLQLIKDNFDFSVSNDTTSDYDLYSKISFENCKIKCNCDFSILEKTPIEFSNMDIDLSNFNNTSNSLYFNNCHVINTRMTHLLSKEISFVNCEMNYSYIFLTATANSLESFSIDSKDKNDLNNNYRFLPDFCPNIRRLCLGAADGKLTSLDFIPRLKFLVELHTNGLGYESQTEAFFEFNSEEEKQKIKNRNKQILEIYKILHGGNELSDKYLSNIEKERVLRLANFYYRLSLGDYSKAELEAMFKNYDKYLRAERDCYYILKDGRIIPVKKDSSIQDVEYIVAGPYVAKKILNEKLFKCFGKIFYYMDATPIIIDESWNKIETIKQAKSYIEKNGVQDTEELTYTDVYINYLIEEFFNEENYCDIDDFGNRVYKYRRIECPLDLLINALEERYPELTFAVNRLKEIRNKVVEINTREKCLDSKEEETKEILINIIADNLEQLNVDEIIYFINLFGINNETLIPIEKLQENSERIKKSLERRRKHGSILIEETVRKLGKRFSDIIDTLETIKQEKRKNDETQLQLADMVVFNNEMTEKILNYGKQRINYKSKKKIKSFNPLS
ncbi:MAG: hypothetical protein J6B98_06080 [Bacilli bacterium]|nr:hypothetical protein [Bacilli bacterium]